MKISLQFKFYAVMGLIILGTGCVQPDRKVMMTEPRRFQMPKPIAPLEQVGGVDPRVSDQWALSKVGMTEVWRSNPQTGTRRVTVALIGSGVDYNHEDLRDHIWINPKEAKIKKPGDSSPLDGVDDDANGYVDDWVGWDVVNNQGLAFDNLGSGTAAAGIMGAVSNNGKGIRGINSQISLIPIRYLKDDGRSSIPHLIQALQYAAAVNPDVVLIHLANIDFAQGIRNEKTREEVRKLEESGIVEVINTLKNRSTPIIISAGNQGVDTGKSKALLNKLSKIENVLIVTSVNDSDQRPFIANYGMQVVGTSAPGEEVLSTLPGNSYGKVSGTYVAAAHVAGAVALAVSRHYGRKTYEHYFMTLLSAAGSDPIAAMEFETLGGNRLNISKFLTALKR